MIQKGAGIGSSRAAVPSEYVSASGIVVSESVRNRIVGVAVAFEQLREVPRTGERVGTRILQLFQRDGAKLLGSSPLTSGGSADLHQPHLARPAVGIRIEPAFAPDHRFHQRRINAVPPCGVENLRVEPVLTPLAIAPPTQQRCDEEWDEDEQSAAFHSEVVIGAMATVEFGTT